MDDYPGSMLSAQQDGQMGLFTNGCYWMVITAGALPGGTNNLEGMDCHCAEHMLVFATVLILDEWDHGPCGCYQLHVLHQQCLEIEQSILFNLSDMRMNGNIAPFAVWG